LAIVLTQTLPLVYSMIFAVSVAGAVFVWRYAALRKKAMDLLYSLPTILVAGPKLSGKSSMINLITNEETSAHIFMDNIKLSRLKLGGHTVQFVELPSVGYMKVVDRMNLKNIIYIFDVSDSAKQIERQMQDLEMLKVRFGDVMVIPIANKVHDSKLGKLEGLRGKFERVYEIPDFGEYDKNAEIMSHMRKELEDITGILNGMYAEIAKEPPTKTTEQKIDGSTISAHK
jgi:GTP1/Obg family GTP-binding protein